MLATEEARVLLNNQLDRAKTQNERNKLGQFATPTALAIDIIEAAQILLPSNSKIRFLDPAFGTGSFYSALLQRFSPEQIIEAVGYEIDPHYGLEATKLWNDTPLKLHLADFTLASPPLLAQEKANLIICNPPYVRHHHLTKTEKQRLQRRTEQTVGIKLSGLAGLYCYFLCLSYAWMQEGGLAGWLIPSGFMDVNYGQQIKEFLLNRVTLLGIHRFAPADLQFEDALVSSAVIWFKKAMPPDNHAVAFTYGGSLTAPQTSQIVSVKELSDTAKWTQLAMISHLKFKQSSLLDTAFQEQEKPLAKSRKNSPNQMLRLSDLFTIKRGLATGANNFFVLTTEQIFKHQIPQEFLIPVLPSPRYLLVDEIEADSIGNPVLERQLFLLKCHLTEEELTARYPSLWEYLQLGRQKKISERYLCRHRSPWYLQENRPPSPFLCTYMGRTNTSRGKAFRFILNHSMATATNVYLMLYPKPLLRQTLENSPKLLKKVWQALSQISEQVLLGEGRVYGGGLHKLEPKELGNASAQQIVEVLPNSWIG
jgi:hypothetical protein